MADGCFLVLCGIPGSGKSTLAKDLIKKDCEIAGKCVHFVYINYDDFIPENLPVEQIPDAALWKSKRRDVINDLQKLLLSKESSGIEGMSDSFGERSTYVSCWCSCGANQIIRSRDALHVIVIDDNMYYRSMRYEYYQLARKTSFSFAEIYFHCPVDVALTRNAQRSTLVKEDTIVKMFRLIEKPESEKFNWERFNVTIDTSISETADKYNTIMKLLEDASAVPSPPMAMRETEDLHKTKDREITEKSIVHQADQIIRKSISQKLEAMRKSNNPPSDTLTKVARYLNERRKKVMEQIKKEPRLIFNRDRNDFCPGVCSKDNSAKPDECFMDDAFLWDNFWDVTSPEEFGGIVRSVFEQV